MCRLPSHYYTQYELVSPSYYHTRYGCGQSVAFFLSIPQVCDGKAFVQQFGHHSSLCLWWSYTNLKSRVILWKMINLKVASCKLYTRIFELDSAITGHSYWLTDSFSNWKLVWFIQGVMLYYSLIYRPRINLEVQSRCGSKLSNIHKFANKQRLVSICKHHACSLTSAMFESQWHGLAIQSSVFTMIRDWLPNWTPVAK